MSEGVPQLHRARRLQFRILSCARDFHSDGCDVRERIAEVRDVIGAVVSRLAENLSVGAWRGIS